MKGQRMKNGNEKKEKRKKNLLKQQIRKEYTEMKEDIRTETK